MLSSFSYIALALIAAVCLLAYVLLRWFMTWCPPSTFTKKSDALTEWEERQRKERELNKSRTYANEAGRMNRVKQISERLKGEPGPTTEPWDMPPAEKGPKGPRGINDSIGLLIIDERHLGPTPEQLMGLPPKFRNPEDITEVGAIVKHYVDPEEPTDFRSSYVRPAWLDEPDDNAINPLQHEQSK